MKLIYSISKVEKVLKDFSLLTQFRIALFDRDFHERLAYPSRLSEFCKLIRTDDCLNEACRLCDFDNFCRCKKERHSIVYECHMGLTELIVPIMSSDTILGYLMCGQIFSSNQTENWFYQLTKKLSSTDIDLSQLKLVSNTHTICPEPLLASVLNLTEILSSYLQHSNLLSYDKSSLAYEIDQYIISHISEPIDVSLLCKHFHYQKTSFYKLTNEFYGTGIMKHIKSIRIQRAKELLSTTELNISEVAFLVGFEDYNYFTKVFKQETNCTPREYRKNNITFITKRR